MLSQGKKCNEKFKNNFLREIRGSRIYSSNHQVEINQAKKKSIYLITIFPIELETKTYF